MFEIDYKSRTPICDQIVNQVVRFKILGILKEGDRLPSVRQTAIELGVNPNTVQKAYTLLETKGITVSMSGKGSFISSESDAEIALKNSAKNEIKEALKQGKKIGITLEEATELITKIYMEADDI